MSPTEQPPTPSSAAALDTTTPAPTPPISRAKHTRIDIWRNEVAALTLDTTARDSKSSSRHSPPPSSATSSASSASSGVLSPSSSRPRVGDRLLSGSSGSGDSRARRVWNRLSARITGRPVQPPLQDVIRTDMYRIEPTPAASAPLPPTTAAAAAAAAVTPRPEDEGQDITLESSGEDAGRGGLKEKQERLERAARLLEQQHGV